MTIGKRETNKEKKSKTLYSETGPDQILRAVELPTDIDTDRITAARMVSSH